MPLRPGPYGADSEEVPDGVEMLLPYADHLSAHEGVFHGGVISALIDTSGCGAVMAGRSWLLLTVPRRAAAAFP